MEKNIHLSIIIPVYNSEKYLEKCVESILAQSFTEYELILVDDASTDTSGKICDRYAQKDNRVKVVRHLHNKGLSLARESGFLASSGNWITFVDNDDCIAPDMYERLAVYTNEADLICGRGEERSCDEIDNIIWNNETKDVRSLSGIEAARIVYSKSKDLGFIGALWGKLIKRELIEKVRIEVEQYKDKLKWVFFEDVLFTPIMFLYAPKVVFDNSLMYLHRHITGSLSATLIPKVYHYEAVAAGDVLLEYFKKYELKDVYDKYLSGYLMLIQSTWYKVWKNEKNQEQKKEFEKEIDRLFGKYGTYYKREVKCITLIERINTNIFMFNKNLWSVTVGWLYFVLLRKLMYKE